MSELFFFVLLQSAWTASTRNLRSESEQQFVNRGTADPVCAVELLWLCPWMGVSSVCHAVDFLWLHPYVGADTADSRRGPRARAILVLRVNGNS